MSILVRPSVALSHDVSALLLLLEAERLAMDVDQLARLVVLRVVHAVGRHVPGLQRVEDERVSK